MVRFILSGILVCGSAFCFGSSQFDFMVIGDTAYNGEPDYRKYKNLINAINNANPTFTIHVGDIWGIGNCGEKNRQLVAYYFDSYQQPLIYTPGDNEWVDCHYPIMGGFKPHERLQRLRDTFFKENKSLGRKKMPLIRQADISKYKRFAENLRWDKSEILFITVNVPGSANNLYPHVESGVGEFYQRNQANIAWLYDSFHHAEQSGYKAVVIALHAEMFEFDKTPYTGIIDAIKVGARRFEKPVLLVHGDAHKFIIDRPFAESRGEEALPLYTNITRLQTYGAPELRAVRVGVDPDSKWVFSFSPFYIE